MMWASAQSARWSVWSLDWAPQPHTSQSGWSHCRAVCWWALARRPRCATPVTCSPLVTTAARKGSSLSIMSRTTDTGTGPKPTISHTCRSPARPLSRASKSTRTMTLASTRLRLRLGPPCPGGPGAAPGSWPVRAWDKASAA